MTTSARIYYVIYSIKGIKAQLEVFANNSDQAIENIKQTLSNYYSQENYNTLLIHNTF